jgi:hypothetical protein|tara:strand:- start:5105 stop:5443 length:339 start_codon:yes stop_codon:yes gene_type:complete
MKITRKHLRNIIKEEISRLVEQTLETDEVVDEVTTTGAMTEKDEFLNKLYNASNELAPGYSDPLDDLAQKLLNDEVTLEFAQSETFEMLDLLAQLDNAAEIGVIEAAEMLDL